MDELDKKLEECRNQCDEAKKQTDLALLKLQLFQLTLNLKTEDYERYKNLEARIKEWER